jgi:hypothetical protein
MKFKTLYPPGGGEPITFHPSKIDEMLSKGWTFENQTKAKSKVKQEINDNGDTFG